MEAEMRELRISGGPTVCHSDWDRLVSGSFQNTDVLREAYAPFFLSWVSPGLPAKLRGAFCWSAGIATFLFGFYASTPKCLESLVKDVSEQSPMRAAYISHRLRTDPKWRAYYEAKDLEKKRPAA